MLTLAGCKIQSSNTDGLTTLVPKNKLEEYYKVCDEFCKLSSFTLEYVEYEKLITFAVNDYLAIKKGEFKNPQDKYKQKGALFLEGYRIGKGKRFSEVICRALNQYFINNISIEDTINNCNYLPDFTKFEKTGKQFNVEWGDQPTQQTNRFYVSTNGKQLSKWDMFQGKKQTEPKLRRVAILKDVKVTLANKYTDAPFESYNVDKQYYINVTNEILAQFKTFEPNFPSDWDSEFLAK